MTDFIVNSLIASLVLTALVNVIPRLFPGSSAEARMLEMLGESPDPTGAQQPGAQPPGTEPPGAQPPGTQPPGTEPSFRIWFPWKQMVLWSMAITVVLNVLALLD